MVSLQEILNRHKFYSNSSVQGGDDKKGYCIVRSGIRTHAYKCRLRPERSALDHSAILTAWMLSIQVRWPGT